MKTNRILNQIRILLLLMLLIVSACKQDKESAPDVAASIAGT